MIKRVLTNLKGKIKKKMIAVFDIESENWTDIKLIGYYDENGYKAFYKIDEFLDFILKRENAKKNFYAHFGGRYDFLALMNELIKRKYKVIPILAQSRILILKIKKGKYTFNLIDSFNIIPTSLKTIGENIDLEKMKINFSTNLESQNLLEYNKRDCEILYNALVKFQEVINNLGGELKNTIASTSMDLFRRKYLKQDIPDNSFYDQYIREAYYGGRCEIFKKIGEPCYYSDFNSLYPSVMKNNLMPTGKAHMFQIKNLNHFRDEPCAFVYAQVITPPHYILNIPLLPYRYKGKLIFPQGIFEGWWDIILLRKAEELGYIIKPSKIITFSDYKDIFTNFVNDLYNLRLEAKTTGNKMLNTVAKLLMNSLYGKFGQRIEQEELIINPDEEEILAKELKPYLPYLEPNTLEVYIKKTISRACFIHPEISAHITALAQLKLYNAIEEANRKQIDIFYTDTDSLFTSKFIEDSHELGKLKLEGKYDIGYFIYPKVYIIPNSMVKIKGFKTENLSIVTYNEKGEKEEIPITQELAEKMLKKEITLAMRYIDVAPFKSSLKQNEFFTVRETVKTIKLENFEKRYFIGIESYPWFVKDNQILQPDLVYRNLK